MTDEAKELLAEEGYDPQYGARPLKRAIQRMLQDPLAMKILEGEFPGRLEGARRRARLGRGAGVQEGVASSELARARRCWYSSPSAKPRAR